MWVLGRASRERVFNPFSRDDLRGVLLLEECLGVVSVAVVRFDCFSLTERFLVGAFTDVLISENFYRSRLFAFHNHRKLTRMIRGFLGLDLNYMPLYINDRYFLKKYIAYKRLELGI